jgi:hypothetical protein
MATGEQGKEEFLMNAMSKTAKTQSSPAITPWERKEPKKRENDKEGKKETWEGYLLRRICI